MQPEEPIGHVTRYDPDDGRVELVVEHGPLKTGDVLHFEGPERNFAEAVHSLQRRREPVRAVEEGSEAEVWVRQPVKEGAPVHRIRYPYPDDRAELMERFFDRIEG